MKKLKRIGPPEKTDERPNGNAARKSTLTAPQNGHQPAPPPFYEQVMNAKLEALSKRMETTQRLEVMGHNLGDVQASMARAHQQQQELYQNLKSELSHLEQSVHGSEQLESKIESLVALQRLLIRIVVGLGIVLVIAVVIALVLAHRAAGASRNLQAHTRVMAAPLPVKPLAAVVPAARPKPASPPKMVPLRSNKSITHASYTQAAPPGNPAGGIVRSHTARNARPAVYRGPAFHHRRLGYRRSQAGYRLRQRVWR